MRTNIDLSDFHRSCDNIEGESHVLRALATSAKNFGNSYIAEELSAIAISLAESLEVIKSYVSNDIQKQYQRQAEASNNMFTLAMGMGKLLDDVKSKSNAL